MSRLAIDFAPRTARALWYRLPLAVMLLMALALLLIAAAGVQMVSLQQQTAQVQQALALTGVRDRAPVERTRTAAAPVVTPAQAVVVNTAIKKLNVPWEELLDALEEAASPKVALLELRPDIVTRQLVAVAEAGNSDAMFAYVRKLQGQPMLTSVYLSSHQVSEQDRNKPIRFEFTATWREFQP
jgi:Tfp pilus assembly protein PilN